MIEKNFLKKLKEDYSHYNSERRQIINSSNVILHDSKRTIFALHRNELEKAEENFLSLEKAIKGLNKKFGYHRLMEEGAYKAGIEEYVEAKMYYFFLTGSKVNKIKDLKIDFESYLGGICDLTGELARRAINEASDGNLDEVKKIKEVVSDLMVELVEFDMTGYLRTKYDQAQNSLRKIEQTNYEISLRK